MRFMVILGLAVFSFQAVGHAKSEEPAPRQIVEKFYRKYFVNLDKPRHAKMEMAFSRGLRALISEDDKLCKKFADGDICGFGADADVYLDAQDFGPKLTFEKAGAVISEPQPNVVRIRFNLFPEDKGSEPREISFPFVEESGHWKVDDIVYKTTSARKILQEEIDSLKKPRP